MRPQVNRVRIKGPNLDMEELARSLPGGRGPQHDIQALLRHVICYIEFLQKRIRDTQNMLVPNSSQLGFWPLWSPRYAKTGNYHLNAQNRCQPMDCAVSPDPDSEPGAGQKLVPYVSSSSSENGDLGPWMVSVSVSPHPPLSPSTPPSSVPSFLGLSPSLRSSPVDDVTVGGMVPPVLFEEVQIYCSSPVQESSVASTLSLDHSYQIQYGFSTGRSGASEQQMGPRRERLEASAGRGLKKRPPGPGTKSRAHSKARGGAGNMLSDPASGKPRKTPDCGQKPARKKCVNGFIMFCRMNRRPYLRANPGTASTAATRHLAELWRAMSVQERRPYCVKALQFSLVHDRLVKHVTLPHRAPIPVPPSRVQSPRPFTP